eukprot:COSAG01_NODE_177_length_22954_cov_28.699554_17_plen_140_part_00
MPPARRKPRTIVRSTCEYEYSSCRVAAVLVLYDYDSSVDSVVVGSTSSYLSKGLCNSLSRTSSYVELRAHISFWPISRSVSACPVVHPHPPRTRECTRFQPLTIVPTLTLEYYSSIYSRTSYGPVVVRVAARNFLLADD